MLRLDQRWLEDIPHRSIAVKYLINMASQSRFERLTCPLGGGCSIHLSYWDLCVTRTAGRNLSGTGAVCHAASLV